jgi:hypothetical protein
MAAFAKSWRRDCKKLEAIKLVGAIVELVIGVGMRL